MEMNKVKTKFNKHLNDNQKRCNSIKEKEKTKFYQSQIIKKALENSTLSNGCSRKIVFTDDNNKSENFKGKKKMELFNYLSSEDECFDFTEKTQFDGKKGFELLNLQSIYANDERFKIDERFAEKEKHIDGNDKTKATKENAEANNEKDKQIKIMQSVLEQSMFASKNEKKEKKSTYEMVRYDALNKDHEKYEIRSQLKNVLPLKKKKEKNIIEGVDLIQQPNEFKVSMKKFYKVSNKMKSSFKEKKKENNQFSLLETYGTNDFKNSQGSQIIEDDDSNSIKEKIEIEAENDSNYQKQIKNSQDSQIIEDDDSNSIKEKIEIEAENDSNYAFIKKKKNGKVSKNNSLKQENVDLVRNKIRNKSVMVKGIWKESFFFIPDDSRFKEGLEFINKKDSKKALEATENYDKTRKKLKEILRLHLKKHLHKKDPFKNKVGGMNKKQLANSKSKHSKTVARKKFSG